MLGEIKILFFDDNSEDAELMKIELERVNFKFTSHWVDTKEDYLKALREFVPDVILCDYSMPSFNGMEAFKLLKGADIHIPFIVVTGAISEQLALDFLNEGVDDFILKSSFGRVPKSIEKAIEKKNTENKIKQSEANLKVIFGNTLEGFILTDENNLVKSFNKRAGEIILKFIGNDIVVGKSVFDFIGNLDKRTPPFSQLSREGETNFQHNESFRDKDNNIGWINFSINNVIVDGNIKGLCITLRDITELKQSEEKIRIANRMYAFISEVNKTIVKVNEEETLFKNICEIAVEHGKFKMAWIGKVDPIDKSKSLVEASGMNEEDMKLLNHLPYQDFGYTKKLFDEGIYLCNDIQNEKDLADWHAYTKLRGINSCLVFLIKKSGVVIATYNLYSTQVDYFNKDEMELLEEVAENISFILDFFEKEKLRKEAEVALNKLNTQLQQLTSHLQHIREEERKHIAREIHDELGQQLTALKMDIGWIAHKQKNPDREIASKLQNTLNFCDSIIKTVRRISSELRPAIIDDLGLIAALEWKCQNFEEKQEIPCEFNNNIKERKFDSNFSITVFRILQETLTNVTRHADAKSVKVNVDERNNIFIMEIIDDGKGFDAKEAEKGRTLGMMGMKERALLIGGELSIVSEINKGTKTILSIKQKK